MTTTSRPARWTHTATLLVARPVGAEQFGKVAAAGSTITLWKDPADQDGDQITFRQGSGIGVALLSDLADVAPAN